MGMYKALDIAKYIVTKCVKDGNPISNLQLQKMLYFVQINFIKNLGQPAFQEEMEAWRLGPVIPVVYRIFMLEGSSKILRTFPEVIDKIDKTHRKLIDMIIEECIKLTPWQLVARTHKEGTPWKQYYKQGKKKTIPNESVMKYVMELK